MCSRQIFVRAAMTAVLGVASLPAFAKQTSTCGSARHLDANDVDALIGNTGVMFRSSGRAYTVPRFSEKNAMYRASLWIGGEIQGELRVAAVTYGEHEFWPGPLNDDGDPPSDCAAFDRMYKVRASDVNEFENTSRATDDLRDWPTGLGAPTIDADGRPVDLSALAFDARADRTIDLAGGERPLIVGSQAIWWVMNDRGGEHQNSKTDPIGVEVHGTAFAAASAAEEINRTTYYRFRIVNRNERRLENAYVAMLFDPDLGMNLDDYIASDSIMALGFTYNADNDDEGEYGYGMAPPALGVQFLRTPSGEKDGLDNDWDGQVDEPGEDLGLSYFNNRATPPVPPNVDPKPPAGKEFYNFMRGMYRPGVSYTEGGIGLDTSGRPIRYMYPADPVSALFWSERNTDGLGKSNRPFERTMLMSSGPFNLDPGEETELAFSIVWARGADHLDSIEELKSAVQIARSAFENALRDLPVGAAPSNGVSLASPEDGATAEGSALAFSWNSMQGARAYELEIVGPDTLIQVVSDHNGASGFDLSGHQMASWRVRAVNEYGVGPWSETRWLALRDDDAAAPDQPFILYGNFPEPFSDRTTIRFFLARSSRVRIDVFDVLGRAVTRLADDTFDPGNHSATFAPNALPSGMYFYSISIDGRRETRSLVRVR